MTALRDALARKDISKTDKYLLIVAHHDGPVAIGDIRAIARDKGWKDGDSASASTFLKASPHALLLPKGWTILGPGRRSLEDRGLLLAIGVLTPVTEALEKIALDVRDADKARFVEETIACVKNKSYRAAIVLSWVGALYLLYAHVAANKLAEFNAEATRRFQKLKPASNIDDLAGMVKEAEFISILEHIKVITKGEGKELTGCLDRRNTAGHPNSHTFTEVNVGHHIETLINTVYKRY